MSFWGGSKDGQPVIMKELPTPVTKEEYEQVARECLEELLGLIKEDEQDGWSEIPFRANYGKDDIKLYDKESSSEETINTIKVIGSVKCHIDDLFEILATTDEDRMKVLEKDLISSEIIEKVSHDLCVVRQRFSVPFPVTNREIVAIRCRKRYPDGRFISFGKSINHRSCTSTGQFVRATAVACVFCEPLNEKRDKVRITKIVRIDPKGMIPAFVIKQAKTKAAIGVCTLRKYLSSTADERENRRRLLLENNKNNIDDNDDNDNNVEEERE